MPPCGRDRVDPASLDYPRLLRAFYRVQGTRVLAVYGLLSPHDGSSSSKRTAGQGARSAAWLGCSAPPACPWWCSCPVLAAEPPPPSSAPQHPTTGRQDAGVSLPNPHPRSAPSRQPTRQLGDRAVLLLESAEHARDGLDDGSALGPARELSLSLELHGERIELGVELHIDSERRTPHGVRRRLLLQDHRMDNHAGSA